MYSVSSGFQSTANAKNAKWSRQLIVGNSDYSAHVIKWPIVRKTWNTVSPGTVSIDLANEDRCLNFIFNAPINLELSCSLGLGFQYAVGSSEYLTVFQGRVDNIQYARGAATLTLVDKFAALSQTVVGDPASAQAYTGSSYLVHDMAWYLCTSYGGFSALTSTSNPDIDYTAFTSWSSLFSADNTRLQASFSGQRITELLQKISNLTQTSIYPENGKLKFVRWLLSSVPSFTFSDGNVIEPTVTVDQRSIVNEFYVSGAYSTGNSAYAITVVAADSSSVNSFGSHEDTSVEKNIWLVDSLSASNLAQRMVFTFAQPWPNYDVPAPWSALPVTVGDTVLYNDSLLQVSSLGQRILSEAVDMSTGIKTFSMNRSQYRQPFTLDISALDSSDVLT
jgi:hypothetical protein